MWRRAWSSLANPCCRVEFEVRHQVVLIMERLDKRNPKAIIERQVFRDLPGVLAAQFCREADKFNGVTFFAFMKSLRRTSIRTGRRVVVITDHARYHPARLHKEWREEHAQDFGLDYLPPSSPELNPIERVWKLTRRR